ncbi:FAD-dependent oxidoreductase, partial [Candidatus Berkelbacteria bacterium]|nr:FAD-dependent oxidoreductase [Candidatus Berkelbacteria bacterium]
MKDFMKHYDVIVVGTGGASKLVSPVARLGYEVAVVEHGPFGGTCLNRGCIPSKMLIHAADVARNIRDAHRFGIDVETDFGVRFDELIKRVNDTVTADAEGIEAALKRAERITVYTQTAEFVEPKVLKVGNELITADRIFLGAGARPSRPSIEGLDGTPYWTSTEALKATFLPKRLIVIGGGYIAAELGHFFGALGSEVHLLVRRAMLSTEDRDTAAEFQRAFAAQHHVHLGLSPTKVKYVDGQFTITAKDQTGATSEFVGDALLVATGLQPNSDLLHVERAGIEMDRKGFITVDDHLRTTAPGVWALGDITGHYLFRHAVNFEGNYLFRTLYA